ncbi:hypothetical protein OH687_33820 [Burkholderia anthina]|nr:hypothetical protein OH687_33820 [Burkholderia anthina]
MRRGHGRDARARPARLAPRRPSRAVRYDTRRGSAPPERPGRRGP